MQKGQDGLNGYGKLLNNIQSMFERNLHLTEQMARYNQSIKGLHDKTVMLESGVQEIS